jgi:hypothetical protein
MLLSRAAFQKSFSSWLRAGLRTVSIVFFNIGLRIGGVSTIRLLGCHGHLLDRCALWRVCDVKNEKWFI